MGVKQERYFPSCCRHQSPPLWWGGIFCAAILPLLGGCQEEPGVVIMEDGSKVGVTRGLFLDRWWDFEERGRSYASGQLWGRAESDLRTAIRMRGQDNWMARTYGMHFVEYFPHRELGIVLHNTGRDEEAEKELLLSYSQAPSSRASHYLTSVRTAIVKKTKADRAAPTVTFRDEAKAARTRDYRIRIRGTAKDDSYVAKIRIGQEEVEVPVPEPEIAFDRTLTLSAGQLGVTVEVVDIAGHRTATRYAWTTDRSGPKVRQVTPAWGAHTDAGEIELRLELSDDTALASFRANGQDIPVSGSSTFARLRVASQNGENRIPFEAVDTVGNPTRGFFYFTVGEAATASDATGDLLFASTRLGEELGNTRSNRNSIAASPEPNGIGPSTLLLTASTENAGPRGALVEVASHTEGATLWTPETEIQLVAQENLRLLMVDGDLAGTNLSRGTWTSHYVKVADEGENKVAIQATSRRGVFQKKELTLVRKLPWPETLEARLGVTLFPLDTEHCISAIAPEVPKAWERLLREKKRFQVDGAFLEKDMPSYFDDPMEACSAAKESKAELVLLASIREAPGGRETVVYVFEKKEGRYLGRVDEFRPDDKPGTRSETADWSPLFTAIGRKLTEHLPVVRGRILDANSGEVVLDRGNNAHVWTYAPLWLFSMADDGEKTAPKVLGEAVVQDVEKERSRAALLLSNAQENPSGLPRKDDLWITR